jgi:futalosine hydrolase
LSVNGVIVPTIPEADLIMEGIPDRECFFTQGKRFYSGNLNGASVVLSICGIGKANAAHGAALLFEKFKPARIYALGVAGAYPSSGLEIGDIAVADKEIYGDEGLMTEDGILTMDELVLPIASVDCCDYYNEFPLFVPDKLKAHKHIGAFVTVSTCTGTLKNGMSTCKRFNAICENMEGAAIAHIGLLNNIPVTEIRGVSNIIEDREGKPLERTALRMASENVQRFFMEKFFPD